MSVFTNSASSTAAEISAYVQGLLDLLGQTDPLVVLSRTPSELRQFLDSVPPDASTRPEAPGKWSIRDVVQHLADAELVGGFRLRLVLAQDRPPLTGYDQDLWATRLRYSEVAIADALDQFLALRKANLRLWSSLEPADLTRVGLHSERGEESLDHLRRLYAGHDLMHLRQLARIRRTILAAASSSPTTGR
jgi:hypothetical protein